MSGQVPAIPTAVGGDHALVVVRALMGAVPVFGGSAVEIFNALVTPPIERRRREWMEAVGQAIQELYHRDASVLRRIVEDQVFHSILLDATWVAVRSHQAEKLAALKNVVINTARGHSLDEDWKLLFVRYVDELTPTHFLVLRYLAENEADIAYVESLQTLTDAFNSKSGSAVSFLHFKLICDDLSMRGLIRVSDKVRDLPGLYSETLLAVDGYSSRDPKIIVTDYGWGFVAFVLNSAGAASV